MLKIRNFILYLILICTFVLSLFLHKFLAQLMLGDIIYKEHYF